MVVGIRFVRENGNPLPPKGVKPDLACLVVCPEDPPCTHVSNFILDRNWWPWCSNGIIGLSKGCLNLRQNCEELSCVGGFSEVSLGGTTRSLDMSCYRKLTPPILKYPHPIFRDLGRASCLSALIEQPTTQQDIGCTYLVSENVYGT